MLEIEFLIYVFQMFEPFCWYLLILVTATVKDYVSKYLQTRATVLKYWKGQRWTAHRMSKEPNSAGIARNFVFHSSFEHLGKVKFGRCHWYHSNICFLNSLNNSIVLNAPFAVDEFLSQQICWKFLPPSAFLWPRSYGRANHDALGPCSTATWSRSGTIGRLKVRCDQKWSELSD